jgi:hypothetical protein
MTIFFIRRNPSYGFRLFRKRSSPITCSAPHARIAPEHHIVRIGFADHHVPAANSLMCRRITCQKRGIRRAVSRLRPSSTIIGVLTIVVITDLTTGTRRFNLAHGVVGAVIGISASLSTMSMGFFFQYFGRAIGFVSIAGVAGAGTGLLWMFLSETKPKRYMD